PWSGWQVNKRDGLLLAPIELAPIPCNDKAVEKLSRLAVTYINEDRADGYKFALNRIANVHLHAQGPAGNVYYLDLDVLETKCPIGSPKPWKRCDIRPFMETQISGNCNTTILHTTEGYTYLYSYDCTLVPDPPEKLQQTCPTCPLLLPADSQVAVNAARITLDSYRRQSTLGAGLGVKKITRASAQVPTAGFCAGSVHGDMDYHPDVQVSCEMFKLQVEPVQPQGHDLIDPVIPTFPPVIPDPGNDPAQPPAVQPEVPPPAVPTAFDPAPFDPSVFVNPSHPLTSSSSESEEGMGVLNQQQPPPPGFDSSSEEIAGLVALRPPFNFRYQKPDRKKRQALQEATPVHQPIFLSDFPSGSSPFRSCPGPARYTTV
uniref:Si:ch211-262h13.5 n=1 Tax=Myripristis murdjan TaxID=586833 RepID=A0A668ADB0_9TELE